MTAENTSNPVSTDPTTLALKNGQIFVRLTSLLTFTTGIILISQPLIRHSAVSQRLTRLVLPANVESANFVSLITGLCLTYLAYELLQRKRSAWLVALGASIGSLISQLYLLRPTIHAIFLIVVIASLLIGHDQFVVKAPAIHIVQGFRTLGASIILALAYGTLGFWLLDRRDFGRTFSLGESFENTLQQFWPFGNTSLVADSRYGDWFLRSLSIVGIATFLYCLYSILRPLDYELREAPEQRARAQELLEKYGGGVDDYFKLWPHDKSFFFSEDGEAFVAYGVARGVAIVLADPEGKPASIGPLVTKFQDFCFNNGWLVAFVAASDKNRSLFIEQGYSEVLIGADAVVNINKFLTETVRNKYFRNIVNRFEKGKFACGRYMPPHDPKLIAELQRVSNDWLKVPGRKEWRFVTGRFSSRYFRDTPLFVIRDEKGKPLAFANEIPSYKSGEATIDLMRHRRDIPKNTMDFMFVCLMRQLQADGFEYFNLGMSPQARQTFAGSTDRDFIDYIYLATQRIVATKGLHQYKAKFDPVWEPRYCYYTGSNSTLPQIGLALSKLSTAKRK